jgi:tetratricopeptide (TPR) repeat protein
VSTEEQSPPTDLARTWYFFYGFLGLGFILTLIAAWYANPVTALLWALACLACGGFIGFLFGIPKVLQHEDGSASQYSIRINTNLEQISDWLTKIIVGITLIQLEKAPERLNRASEFIAYSLGGIGEKYFAGALLLYFSIGGFLGAYLLTRLFLTGAFSRADQEAGLPITAAVKVAIQQTELSIQPDKLHLTGEAAVGAQQILSKPLDQLTSVSDIAVWAKAQLNARNYVEAVRGYQKALSLTPDDARLRYEYAIAAREAGQPLNQVKEYLIDAYKRLTPQADKDLKARVYEALTYTFLYLPPPDGFSGAIQYGEEYVNDKSNLQNGGIYVNLAAGYGQKYRWQKEHPDLSVDEGLHDKALDAIKSALAINPKWQNKLRMLLDHTYPNKDPQENDLEVFADDPKFRSALGMT